MSHLRNNLPLRSAATAGFTLVELLLVVAILGILASVAVMNLTGKGDEARIAAQRTSIGTIRQAITTYEMTAGLPKSLDALTSDQPNGGAPLLEKNALTDQWGNQLQYKIIGKGKYEIRSAGPDGKMNTEDDITN